MKRYLPWLLGLGAVLLWGNAERRRGAAQALAEVREDSLAAARQHQLAIEVHRASQDSAARRTITVTTVRVEQNRHVTDSLIAIMDSLRDYNSHHALVVADSIISIQRRDILSLTEALSIAQGRWEAADSSSRAWRQLAENAAAQLKAANKRASPGLLQRVGRALPYIAGAYLVGRFTR